MAFAVGGVVPLEGWCRGLVDSGAGARARVILCSVYVGNYLHGVMGVVADKIEGLEQVALLLFLRQFLVGGPDFNTHLLDGA